MLVSYASQFVVSYTTLPYCSCLGGTGSGRTFLCSVHYSTQSCAVQKVHTLELFILAKTAGDERTHKCYSITLRTETRERSG